MFAKLSRKSHRAVGAGQVRFTPDASCVLSLEKSNGVSQFHAGRVARCAKHCVAEAEGINTLRLIQRVMDLADERNVTNRAGTLCPSTGAGKHTVTIVLTCRGMRSSL